MVKQTNKQMHTSYFLDFCPPREHILEKEICKLNTIHSANIYMTARPRAPVLLSLYTHVHTHTHTHTHAQFVVINEDIQFKLIKLSLGEKSRYDRRNPMLKEKIKSTTKRVLRTPYWAGFQLLK